MKSYSGFTEAYIDLCKFIRDDYEYISSPRGMKIKEKLGVQFRIKNPRDRLPFVKARDFSLSYFVAETLWYMSGSNSTEWISYYATFWKNISDDGQTANSAYGARIFKTHPRIAGGQLNQWEYVKTELKNDPDSRRAVIHIRTPDDSVHAVKDVPCTLALQFFIRDNKLDLHVNMRSSDIILGLVYDVPAFTTVQEIMANELDVELGEYVHTSNSLHCYERDFAMLDEIANETSTIGFPMPVYPKEFPINDLMEVENKVRKMTHDELFAIFLKFNDQAKNKSSSSLVNDWEYVLCSFKARKFKDQNLSQTYLSSTSYQGYHFFRR
jgi:thymidylate synthase